MKKLQEEWGRNGSTSGTAPCLADADYDCDDDDDDEDACQTKC